MAILRTIAATIIVGVLGAASWILSGWWIERQTGGSPAETRIDVLADAPTIGSAFSLRDQRGQIVHSRDFHGRKVILYFGDLAADEGTTAASMQVLLSAIDHLGRTGHDIAPVLIVLDPAPASATAMTGFAEKLASRATVLTGEPAEIDALTRAFRLYVKRIANPELPGGYSLAYSSHYYVLDAQGRFIAVLSPETDPRALADGIGRAVK